MDYNNIPMRRIAVLGAGVMGAQIAAHFVNAGIEAILFDLPGDAQHKNSLVENSLKSLAKLQPSPVAVLQTLEQIKPANYQDDLALLKECDLVIEAIAERLDWKRDLYQKITPFLGENTIISSNTSGLSIAALADYLPPAKRKQFMGMHFFNPPRYMSLVELIPCGDTDKTVLTQMESFLTHALGKQVVYAKDTPNFIANRIGVFSILSIMHYADKYNIGFDVVDELTGTILGRPKSATFRTADVVGLDTLAHTVTTMQQGLLQDPWHALYVTPDWMQELIDKGALGQKTHLGVYKKEGKDLYVFDLKESNYRRIGHQASSQVLDILQKLDMATRFKELRASSKPEAQFLWSYFRDLFHYCSHQVTEIAEHVRDIDMALRAGFGWAQGPFETWQQAGWLDVAMMIKEDIHAGTSFANTPLAAWVFDVPGQQVYTAQGAFDPKTKQYISRREQEVYRKQYYPQPFLAESDDEGETIFESDSVRCWHMRDDIAILSFKTKMCSIGLEVLEGIVKAVDYAQKHSRGLVIWQRHSNQFSVGANLKEFTQTIKEKKFDVLENTLYQFQQACMTVRYATVPVVAAVRGYAFGGGCELMLHCSRTVAAFESYVGLVEAGVGLLPAGGGCKEMVRRASEMPFTLDGFAPLEAYFKQIAMAMAAKSATEAQQFGYLRATDTIVMNAQEVLYAAKQTVRYLSEMGYRAPLKKLIRVQGQAGMARLQSILVNMRAGGFISEYDAFIAAKIGDVLCGGDIEQDSLVDEDWLLGLELQAFMELAQKPQTLERIEYMLKTGKPLRN